MLDIKFIRENQERVAKAIKDKNVTLDLGKLLEVDKRRRDLLQEAEQLRSLKNDLNDIMKTTTEEKERAEAIAKGKEIKEKSDVIAPQMEMLAKQYEELMRLVPNTPSDDTPVGQDESGNVVVREVGEHPRFSFRPKEHWELGADLDVIDVARPAKVSGTRFAYIKGDLVLLEYALMHFALSVLTDEKKLSAIAEKASITVSAKPFVPVLPPVMIRPEMMQRMARLDPEEMYAVEKDKLNLIGSAEHALGAMYADETLQEKDLPLRLVGFSTAFRREAGSYKKDMKGILRLHQFNKLEIESFTTSEHSRTEQDFIVAIQEHLMQALQLPYRVVAVCTGDMGKPDVRQIDIETWLSGQDRYRETHTSDLIGDFQARRLNTKVKRTTGVTELVHMNDATVFSERPLIAIMENYQQEDGSIVIPDVLRPFLPSSKECISRPA